VKKTLKPRRKSRLRFPRETQKRKRKIKRKIKRKRKSKRNKERERESDSKLLLKKFCSMTNVCCLWEINDAKNLVF
jgi:hypothetical protein